MSIATMLVAGLVDNSATGLHDFVRLSLSSDLFRGPEETSCFALLSGFVMKYGVIPSRERFAEQGIILPQTHPEPVAYYVDQLHLRHTHLSVKQALLDAQEALNADKPMMSVKVLEEIVLRLTKTQYKRKLVDFANEGHKMIADALKQKKLQGDNYGVQLGWPTLDNMAGGLSGGDVVCIVGRPAQGKTFGMLYTASYAWLHQGLRPALFSMEMKTLPLVQRLAAMNTKKPITQLKKAELSSAAEKSMLETLASYKDQNNFWIADGSLSATMSDIILLCRQLRPDVVWIDGAYLVRGENRNQQRWDRVTEVLERVKGDLADELDVPAIISFQFSRQQKKGMSGELENIAYSDAVGQLSSVVLGLGLSNNLDSVESLYRRRVQILKGRNGEVGEFDINWRFDQGPNYMDFSEIKAVDQSDLVYGTN